MELVPDSWSLVRERALTAGLCCCVMKIMVAENFPEKA